MKVFADNLIASGKIVSPGDRLDFLIVKREDTPLLGNRMRLLEHFEQTQSSDNPDRIDYDYFVEKLLMNPINQLFEVGYKEDIKRLSDITYRPTNRHKAISLEKPVLMLLKMKQYNVDYTQVKEVVTQRLNAPPPKKTFKISYSGKMEEVKRNKRREKGGRNSRGKRSKRDKRIKRGRERKREIRVNTTQVNLKIKEVVYVLIKNINLCNGKLVLIFIIRVTTNSKLLKNHQTNSRNKIGTRFLKLFTLNF